MKTRTLIEYLLAVVIVLILGGLFGWYFFLRTQSQSTTSQDAARGYNANAPFGSLNGSTSVNAGNTAAGGTVSANRPPQLWQVDKTPVAGMAFVSDGTSTQLEYVERSSGYVFEADPQTGANTRLTNTLMPKIYEAQITANGRVIERSLDETGNITTFVGSVSTSTSAGSDATSTVGALTGLYLAKNIMHISADPNSSQLFYLVAGAGGVSGVMDQSASDGKQKQIFTSILPDWRTTWLSDGRIILTQAAAYGVPGYAYQLKSDGTLVPLLRGIAGLTVSPRSSGALIFGASGNNAIALFAQLPGASAVQLPIRTIADKCVWAPVSSATASSTSDTIAYCAVPQVSPTGNFLDNWYQGALHTADAFWEVDASAGTAELIFTPGVQTPLDVENTTMDAGGNYIAFENGADESLWVLRLAK